MNPARHYFKWNMNEINRLYNEYEIKQLTTKEIADLHKRTEKSIIYKLQDEGIYNDIKLNIKPSIFFEEDTDNHLYIKIAMLEKENAQLKMDLQKYGNRKLIHEMRLLE